MKRARVAIVTLSLLVALAPLAAAQAAKATFTASAVKQPLVRKSAETITAAELKDYLSFVASDEMEGRTTPSRGLDTTAKFIATMLSRWGVKPAGDEGSYFQKIVLKKEKVLPSSTEAELAGKKFIYGRDFLCFASMPAGPVSGGMVFAGDGWFIKAKNVDAYQGIDPKGKIVIITQGGLPAGLSQEEAMKILTGGKRGEDWIDPNSYARKKGAIGIIVLPPLLTQASPDAMERMRKTAEEGTYQPEKLASSEGAQLPTLVAYVPLAQAIFAKEKTDARAIMTSFPGGTPVKPFELTADKRISFTVKTTSETLASQNVVGMIEGSDPVLKGEYVALGAHYDHSGTATSAPPGTDAIFNGADDDGTGTVALLAIAESLSKAPRRPRRSAIFVWHMGEERGLWGSRYFTTFPTVPIDKIVAQLNIDMIGRSKAEGDTNPRDKDLSGPNELYVIGSKMMSTELGELSEAVNNQYLKLSFNYKYDDPKDPERFFYRSDHIEYARKNIPIIFYFTGVHADYHQLSDEVSRIDFPKFEKVTRTVYMTLWEIAEMKARPRVDKELPAEAKQGLF